MYNFYLTTEAVTRGKHLCQSLRLQFINKRNSEHLFYRTPSGECFCNHNKCKFRLKPQTSMMWNLVLVAYVIHFSLATFIPLFQYCCKNLISSTVLLTLTYFFNIYYISEGNSSVVNMAISISGIENFTEVCRTFGSIFEVGKSDILQLGTVNVTDVKTEFLGMSIFFCYSKITKTKKQQNNTAIKYVRVYVCRNVCVSVLICVY